MSRIGVGLVAVAAVVAGLLVPSASIAAKNDTARYILPPGNYGGIPFTENSTDQLPLYSALTPLRDDISEGDIEDYFLPENFRPIGATHEEETGREGLRLIYDSYNIPHIYGDTREDVAFGAGWSTARDRGLLLTLGRGPARAAVADIPNLNAFSLVTSARTFEPSAATEALVTDQKKLLLREYGKKGKEIVRDARAYAAGINAYWEANDIDQPPATVNDVLAVTAFIGSIFGAGGGAEAANADLLAKLQEAKGRVRGKKAWKDVMLAEDPEAPTTIEKTFHYGPLTGGRVKGSVVVDPGSIESTDPSTSDAEAAAAPARKQASNFLVTSPTRSASGNSLAVMGPQLGYYYPEIVQQMDLHGPGIKAQGAAVPGLAMYILIGRTEDYAWSLTSAGHDVRDVFAEKLCEPDGSKPSRDSGVQAARALQRGRARRRAGRLRHLGARAGLRHRHGRGPAVRAHAPAVHVRARRPQPRRPPRHDRGQGEDAEEVPQGGEQVRLHVQLGLRVAQEDGVLHLRAAPEARPSPRPAAADAGHRQIRMGRVPESRRASARRRRPQRPAPELEQPVGAGLHARRRRALRVGPSRRALRPVARDGGAHRQRRDHEPRRDRGRALAGLAGGPQGAARRPGSDRP
jgi:hypothetical protein